MKKVLFLFLSAFMVAACSNETPQEQTIRAWLNGKLTDEAVTAKTVKITSTDSVLSLARMDVMFLDCTKRQPISSSNTVYFNLQRYAYHALLARTQVKTGDAKSPEFIAEHAHDWRIIHGLKVIADDGREYDNIEVVLDTDGHPYLTGREYDSDLSLWNLKVESIVTR